MTEYRARLDADVTFSNGGSLAVHGFMIDLPSRDLADDEIGRLFVASLGLLMTDTVRLADVEVVAEPHRGTRGVPTAATTGSRIVDLNHVVRAGMVTYPGLPAPTITPHLTREASREHYAPGTEFAMDIISLIGNTGTYLDSPYHRFDGGTDLAGLPLDRLVDLPTVVVRVAGSTTRGVDATLLAAIGDVAGAAVLLHTGDDARFGTADYARDASYLTADGAEWLVAHGAALVGIDAVNIDAVNIDAVDIDAVTGGSRPAHTALLAAGIPIVEHLTGLHQLPPRGARFTAVPPRVAGFGTFPVRAFAVVPA